MKFTEVRFNENVVAQALQGLPRQVEISQTETTASVPANTTEPDPQYGTTEFPPSAIAVGGAALAIGAVITVLSVRNKHSHRP